MLSTTDDVLSRCTAHLCCSLSIQRRIWTATADCNIAIYQESKPSGSINIFPLQTAGKVTLALLKCPHGRPWGPSKLALSASIFSANAPLTDLRLAFAQSHASALIVLTCAKSSAKMPPNESADMFRPLASIAASVLSFGLSDGSTDHHCEPL